MRVAQKDLYWPLWYLFVSLSLFFLDSKALFVPLHGIAQTVTTPARSWLYQTRINLLAPLSGFNASIQTTQKLVEQELVNAQLLSQISHLRAVEEENDQMRRLLGADLPPEWKFEPGRVVGATGDFLTAVSDGAVEKGTPVIVSQEVKGASAGIFVGKTQNFIGREGKIIMPTNAGSKVPVIVRDAGTRDRQASGIVMGKGGRMLIDQVLSSESLKEGDLVLTSGEGGLPPELLIGYVGQVYSIPGAAWRQADVRSPVDISKIEYVFFVTRY